MYHHIEKITKQRNTINHLQKWSTVTQYNSLFSHNLTFSKFVLNKESTPRNTFSHRNTFSSNLCTSDNFHTKRGISCESNFHVTGLCILCRDAVTRTFASRNHDSTRWCFSLMPLIRHWARTLRSSWATFRRVCVHAWAIPREPPVVERLKWNSRATSRRQRGEQRWAWWCMK